MEWRKWGHVIAEPRRSGKTRALAMAAKECDGVMVCRDQQEADRVAREYGIRTASALGRADRLRGQLAARLVDPDAVLLWLAQAEQEVKQREERIAQLERLLAAREPKKEEE